MIRTICKLRLKNRIRKNGNRKRRKITQDRINMYNLKQIATTDDESDEIVKNIRLSTINARSIKSKENLISNELTNRSIYILIATETWLQDNKQDEAWVSSCKLASSSFQMFTKKQKGPKRRGHCPHYRQKMQSITTKRCACLLQL